MQISTWQHSIAKLLKRALFNPLHPNVLWSINQYSILKKGINRFSIISFYSSKNKIFMYLNRMKKHFFSLLTCAWRSIDIIGVCLREKQVFIIYKIKIQFLSKSSPQCALSSAI